MRGNRPGGTGKPARLHLLGADHLGSAAEKTTTLFYKKARAQCQPGKYPARGGPGPGGPPPGFAERYLAPGMSRSEEIALINVIPREFKGQFLAPGIRHQGAQAPW